MLQNEAEEGGASLSGHAAHNPHLCACVRTHTLHGQAEAAEEGRLAIFKP